MKKHQISSPEDYAVSNLIHDLIYEHFDQLEDAETLAKRLWDWNGRSSTMTAFGIRWKLTDRECLEYHENRKMPTVLLSISTVSRLAVCLKVTARTVEREIQKVTKGTTRRVYRSSRKIAA